MSAKTMLRTRMVWRTRPWESLELLFGEVTRVVGVAVDVGVKVGDGVTFGFGV